jgi:hypothetical protein
MGDPPIPLFAGTSKEDWGSLLTPLVTGVCVRGPFRPFWVPNEEKYRHVYIDTEGLLHAKTTTDVPSELTSRFKDVDTSHHARRKCIDCHRVHVTSRMGNTPTG